jgi:hypothetical protein
LKARRQGVRVFAFFVFLSLLGGRTAGGQTTGSISGRVVHPSGAPIPGVTVVATSQSLQGARTIVTAGDGVYRFPAVPPGSYQIRATLSGFRAVGKSATVSLDATTTVDLTLQLSTEEQVLVSGDAPPIDLTSTTGGTNYTSRMITRLPTARNYADIVRSNPGVSTDRGDTEGRSLALTIYGATSAENQWIIDGVNTTNVFKGVQGKAINNEFVQEVEVKTGGYQAEYGRALGGVINVITKSGGNDFHGDAFLYYDSTGTAAEKESRAGDSSAPPRRPPGSQLGPPRATGIAQMRVVDGNRFDYGADLGGFLLKERLWFFGAYNRVTLGSDVSRLQPSKYVPTDVRFPLDAASDLYSGKLTWNLAGSTTIVGTVFADPSTSSGAAGADPRQGLGFGQVAPPVSLDPSTWSSERFQGGTDFGVRATHLFGSRAIVTLQGSYHKDRNGLTASPGIRYMDQTCLGGTPAARCNFPAEDNSVTGGYGQVFGANDYSTSRRRQYAAGFTLYKGDHEIKAGGDYQDGRTDFRGFYTGGQAVRIRNERGQLYYAHRFFAVSPEDPTVVPDSPRGAQVLDYGAYIQDSWKVAPGLTINAGLRWDGEQTRDYAGRTVLRFEDQWQPRIGVVWDPWKNGATKIYAFAGRFSYALPTVAAGVTFGSFTSLETYNFDPVGVTQDPGVIGHERAVVRGTGAFGPPVDPGVRGWYQDELTVGIERLLGPTLTVGLKGTYRTLRNALENRCDLDSSSPETDFSFCGLMNPGSSGDIASGNFPTCNGLDGDFYECGIDPGPATPSVSRIYRGIELFARKSLGDRLWVQASYIYSSLRGNYDGGVNQGAYGLTWPGINADFDYPQMYHNAYGILALDRPHRFRVDGYWVTPWRLSVGLQAFVESGAPLNRLGYFNEFYGASVFLVPRGSEGRLPTLWGTNLALSYPIAIGPATVTLKADLFNVFNKQIAISRDEEWSVTRPPDYPASLFDPNQEQNNPEYGKVTGRSDPRVFRAAVRVSF